MYEYAFDADLAKFAIIIGIFITLLFYEKYKIAAGGMIVPGYIALFINHPEQIIYTFILAFLIYLFVGRFLMKYMILFGRRRFSITILTGAVFAIIVESIVYSYVQFEPFVGFNFIGMIVPGLIANEFIREGKPTTVLMTISFVSILTFSLVWIISQIEFILFLEIPNIIVLTILMVDLMLLILFIIYILFFTNLENFSIFMGKLSEKLKKTHHFKKLGVKRVI